MATRIDDVASDGQRLLLKHHSFGPVVLDLATNHLTIIKPERAGVGGLAPLAWSPDGRRILTDFAPTFEGAPTVVAVNVANGQMTVLATETRFFAVLD